MLLRQSTRRITQTALLHNLLSLSKDFTAYGKQQTVLQIRYKRSETKDTISLPKTTLKIRQTTFIYVAKSKIQYLKATAFWDVTWFKAIQTFRRNLLSLSSGYK
jgi:hypothetical protein